MVRDGPLYPADAVYVFTEFTSVDWLDEVLQPEAFLGSYWTPVEDMMRPHHFSSVRKGSELPAEAFRFFLPTD